MIKEEGMKLKEFVQEKAWKRWDKSQWTIVILAGILLMVLAIPTGDAKTKEENRKENTGKEEAKSEASQADYARQMEERLGKALSEIDGAGQVKVMITLEDSGESVVEKDAERETSDLQEADKEGGNRAEKNSKVTQSTVYCEEGNDKAPFVGKEMTPRIAGVLVVAQGGDNTAVKKNISEAVMALFQIDVNRIKVVKMNIQEEKF